MPKLQFELKTGDATISAAIDFPSEAIRPTDLLPAVYALNDALIGAAIEKAEVGGQRVSCRAGCGACCRQLVPISETEAFHLAEVIAALPEAHKIRVLERFAEALRALEECGMAQRVRSGAALSLEDKRNLGLEYFQLGLPCPFLENESCSIHHDRPASCREYLVTSPAVNCAAPRADNIAMVALPIRMSGILYRFGDGVGEQSPRWLALTLLLDWLASHGDNDQARIPAPQMFENFMRKLTQQ